MLEKLKGWRSVEWLAVLALIAICLLLRAPSQTDDAEKRMESVLCQVEGAGRVSVLLQSDDQGVKGAVVVAEGAGNMQVLLELQNAVQTLLDLPADCVSVLPMEVKP